ncbi:hypothetical protein PSENEW3n2_00001993 [Picochlorum sp. SENEW3]|nr:hypothetical protein PSENEW3n2_00001993 [Picochlorum sp. SENEW3]WPT14763.1 hypothetical protein PSENEW3_00001993 [Picochlorum sp. SENEW3]
MSSKASKRRGPPQDHQKRKVRTMNSCTHLRWNRENFRGVIAHIRNIVRQLYFPYCEDTDEILILHDTFLIVNDDDVQCLVQDMTYPHNILRLECKCTKQDDSDREKKTEESKDDQLLESLISLCIQDTFPYCKGYFRESVDKLEDFERIPAKHFAVMMQNIMEVLHLDEEAINNFCQKVNQYKNKRSQCISASFTDQDTGAYKQLLQSLAIGRL